jgi:anti-sigma regulatory factor (Ser/Thr protein kinase)
MGEAGARDVVLAVNELASNAVRHGAGRGRLRMWGQDGAVCCQVQDAGRTPDPASPARRRAKRGGRMRAVMACGWSGCWRIR